MEPKPTFDYDADSRKVTGERQPRAVIVELTPGGTAHVRRAPPDVMVLVVESKEIEPRTGGRSVAAGGRGEVFAPTKEDSVPGPCVRQIPVTFPG